MDIRFLHPIVLLALFALPLVWFVPRRLDRAWHGALRALVFGALIVAIAQPIAFTSDDREYHVFVVDRSESIANAQLGRLDATIDRALARLPGSARAVRVDVGRAGPADGRFESTPLVARDGSSLGRAFAVAAAAIPEGCRGAVCVLSDGASTARDWGAATQALTSRGIVVHTVELERRADDAYPVAIRTVEELRVGATAQLHVEVIGSGEVTVSVSGPNGALADPQTATVTERAVFAFEFEPAEAGFLPVSAAVVCAADRYQDNDAIATEFAVQDPIRALYLGGRIQGSGARVRELLGGGFELDVRDSVGDGGLPTDGYDVVMLDDRPAASLPEPFQQQVVSAVADRGLGLVFAGGRASFGPGGYHDTPISAALPVEFVQKEEKRDPSTTLVLIIDTSGSMGGMRVTLAKEVSRLAMKRLLPHDKVGIVEFYGAKRWAAPIQPASNLIELQRALNRLDSGGGTVILPAIEEAFYGLQNVQTRYKHVLILTDGGVESGAFEPLLRKMADRGINVSTVLVGPEAHSEFLVSLANWGKGRFYNVPNRFSIPELLLKQPASAQLPAYRAGTHAVQTRGGRGWWGEVERGSVPPVQGYVETRSRPGASTLLETVANRAPVLATWRHGLGRVTALATEMTGPGTASWSDWSDFGAFVARVASRTARDSTDPFAYRIERRGDEVVVHATRRTAGGGDPVAHVVERDGRVGAVLPFRQRSEDSFEARASVVASDAYRVIAGAQGRRLVSPPNDGIASELQTDPERSFPLSALADLTGGSKANLASFGSRRLRAGDATGSVAVLEFAPWLLAVALLLFLLELLLRRLPAFA